MEREISLHTNETTSSDCERRTRVTHKQRLSDVLGSSIRDQIIRRLERFDIYKMKSFGIAYGDLIDYSNCDARVICVAENDSQTRDTVGKFSAKYGRFPLPIDMKVGDVFYLLLRESEPSVLVFMVTRRRENEIVRFGDFEKCMSKLGDLLHVIGTRRVAFPLFSSTSEKLRNSFLISMIHQYLLEKFEVDIVFTDAFYHKIISEALKEVYKDVMA